MLPLKKIAYYLLLTATVSTIAILAGMAVWCCVYRQYCRKAQGLTLAAGYCCLPLHLQGLRVAASFTFSTVTVSRIGLKVRGNEQYVFAL